MPVNFVSQYVPLAHGAVNWDSQLRTDVTALGGLVNGAVELGSGKDLNGYNFQGTYFGSSFTNAPGNLNDAFLVQVVAASDGRAAVQIAYRMTQNNFTVSRRFYVAGVGWSAWVGA